MIMTASARGQFGPECGEEDNVGRMKSGLEDPIYCHRDGDFPSLTNGAAGVTIHPDKRMDCGWFRAES
jgi:hypothetical protein